MCVGMCEGKERSVDVRSVGVQSDEGGARETEFTYSTEEHGPVVAR